MNFLIGQVAPDIFSKAVMPDNSIQDFRLSEYKKNKIAVVVFYPLDFTFVCPTEILAFSNRVADFERRGARIVLISIDSQFTHLSYKNTDVENGGIGNIQVPMVADINKIACQNYGVLHQDGMAYRGTFIIDKDGVIRHMSCNDLFLGRNVDEILRLIDAIQHHEIYGEVCPANWRHGEEAIKPTAVGIAAYLKANAK